MDRVHTTSNLEDTPPSHACYSQRDLVVDGITAAAAIVLLGLLLAGALGAF